jgi:hypothetical protein
LWYGDRGQREGGDALLSAAAAGCATRPQIQPIWSRYRALRDDRLRRLRQRFPPLV